MAPKLSDLIAVLRPKEATSLIRLMEHVLDKEGYASLVEQQLSNTPRYNERKQLLEAGHFSGSDLATLMLATGCASGVSLSILGPLIARLIDWNLAGDTDLLVPTGLTRYHWNAKLIRQFKDFGILDNILLGPSYIVQKYQRTVPAILVTRGGDIHTGTGFLVSCKHGLVIVTAKHNVDHDKAIKFDGFHTDGDQIYRAEKEQWMLHGTQDIAFMPVSVEPTASVVPLSLSPLVTTLAKTITLGYPKIARSNGPYLLAHGGEINAIVATYTAETRLIISQMVAPGNSGGPVLDESGMCVGMVVEALEAKYDQDRIIATNAALLASQIVAFLQ
jgi:hypothetical protein